MPLLSEDDFQATMEDPMTPVAEETPLPEGFWEYVDTIDEADLRGFRFASGTIAHAYENARGTFHHALMPADGEPDVFLVVVVDPRQRRVVGNHLLDLPRLYGLR